MVRNAQRFHIRAQVRRTRGQHRPAVSHAPPQGGWRRRLDDVDDRVGRLADMMSGGNVVVLSGAGMSTDSGIPDYRGPTATRRHAAMTYQEFISDAHARRRYWARSHVGWRHVALARPNAAHHAVAALERAAWLRGIITQNVDGLHQRAGSRNVVELHGSLATVVCLGCGARTSRRQMARRLSAVNPAFDLRLPQAAPDGDAELSHEVVDRFTVVSCHRCPGGILKPDVVFFGERVPPSRVTQCYEMLDTARVLLVLGSSLTVMSGYRFVIRARQLGTWVAIVNRGPTRGDRDAHLKIDAGLAVVLPSVVDLLGALPRRHAATPG
jgi:NAD-dependent SIR2 family protein deacetylase